MIQTYHFKRGDNWELRPNQKEVVDNFVKAISIGRKNLFMYAVMRFDKSFASLCCALEMKAKLVFVVSANVEAIALIYRIFKEWIWLVITSI